MVYAGTAITYGRGRGVVVATGMATEFGKTAEMLESVASTKTPLQENLVRSEMLWRGPRCSSSQSLWLWASTAASHL